MLVGIGGFVCQASFLVLNVIYFQYDIFFSASAH